MWQRSSSSSVAARPSLHSVKCSSRTASRSSVSGCSPVGAGARARGGSGGRSDGLVELVERRAAGARETDEVAEERRVRPRAARRAPRGRRARGAPRSPASESSSAARSTPLRCASASARAESQSFTRAEARRSASCWRPRSLTKEDASAQVGVMGLEGRKGGRGVHLCDSTEEAQVLRLRGEAAGGEHVLERARTGRAAPPPSSARCRARPAACRTGRRAARSGPAPAPARRRSARAPRPARCARSR